MRRKLIILCLAYLCLTVCAGPTYAATKTNKERPRVDVIQVSGYIDPITVDFIRDSIARAEGENAEALVIQFGSPGSLVAKAEVTDLLKEMADADVPVAIWVGESGAVARGDAYELVRMAPIAGAAPGTELSDSKLSAQEALARGEIAIGAPTLGDFIVDLDGRRISGRTLETSKVIKGKETPRRAPVVDVNFAKPSVVGRILHATTSPSVAYLFVVFGLVLIILEFFALGVGLAAVTGTIFLTLASYGLALLPTSIVGLALLALAMFGFAVDVQSGAPRAWTVIGSVAFVAASLNLFEGLRISWLTFGSVVPLTMLIFITGLPSNVRSRFTAPTIGRDWLIGQVGEAFGDIGPEGTLMVDGAPWKARTHRATTILKGQRARVVGIDAAMLEVEPENHDPKSPGSPTAPDPT